MRVITVGQQAAAIGVTQLHGAGSGSNYRHQQRSAYVSLLVKGLIDLLAGNLQGRRQLGQPANGAPPMIVENLCP